MTAWLWRRFGYARLGGENAVVETKLHLEDNLKKKNQPKTLACIFQSGSQVKCWLESFTINQKQILIKRRQKIPHGLLKICCTSFSTKKSHISLGENSNFSLILLGWEEKWILRHHVPKFWKCHVDLKYMVCICKWSHGRCLPSEHQKNRTAYATKDCCLKTECNLTQGMKSGNTDDLKEFCFPYYFGFNDLHNQKFQQLMETLIASWGSDSPSTFWHEFWFAVKYMGNISHPQFLTNATLNSCVIRTCICLLKLKSWQ